VSRGKKRSGPAIPAYVPGQATILTLEMALQAAEKCNKTRKKLPSGLKSLCENADSAQPAAKQAAEKIAGLCLPLLKLFFST